jgi:hypothetical protein
VSKKSPAVSALTNRSRTFLQGADGRTAWARRFRDLVETHEADLGGPGRLSEAERQIVRRCSALEVECERMEGEIASSGGAHPELLDIYIRASGGLKRMLDLIGLERRPRDVTPSAAQWVAGRAASK